MANPFRFSCLIVAAVFTVACSDATSVPPFPDTLNGTWTALDQVPGSSAQWNLTVSDTIITGTGTWSGEACCGGTLALNGYTSKDSVHVNITFTITNGVSRPPFHEHFDGVLQSTTLLVGQISLEGGPPGPTRLRKGTSPF